MFHQTQTEAGAGDRIGQLAAAEEPVEQVLLLVGWNADALVSDGDRDTRAIGRREASSHTVSRPGEYFTALSSRF